MPRLPIALRKDPIVEAVFEVRFQCNEAASAELLPGLIYPHVSGLFPKLVPMPLAQLPKMVRDQQEQLAYQALHALVGDRRRLALGERMASVSFIKPYPGWKKVRPIVQRVIEALDSTSQVAKVERIGLKYVNVLTIGRDPSDIGVLNVNFELGGFRTRSAGKQLRAEIEHKGHTTIVSVITGANITLGGPEVTPESLSGLVFDVDTLRLGPFDGGVGNLIDRLDEIHNVEKEVFFGLLTAAAIEQMDPVYE